ncbi:MAG: MFS transporter [Acidimicrobiales bacterium]
MSGRRQPLPGGIRALLFTLFMSSFASVGMVTILGKQVYDMTGRAFDLGMLGLAEFLPVFVLAPVAGSVADSFDRRRVTAVALAFEAVCSLGFFAYVSTDPTSLWPIYLLVIAFGVARAFLAPASRALPIDLAPPHLLERVVASRSLAFQAGMISGPIAFGFVFVGHPSWPYLVAAAGFALGTVGLRFTGPTGVARMTRTGGYRQAFTDAMEGLRFIRTTPVLAAAITLDLFAVLLGGAVALLPAIAEERLGVGAVGLGWLRASIGIGAGAMSLALSIRPVRRRVGPVLLVAVGLFGAATVVLGVTRSFPVAVVALLILAGADAISMFIRATIVPLATPEAMRGRVLAVENVFIGASNELGAVESGLTAQWLGLVPAVVLGGVGTLAVVAVFWWLVPALRNVDRFAEVQPATTDGPAP